MRGFCTRCNENRGDGEEWGIVVRMKDDFPVCQKCGAYVEVNM